MTEHASDHSDHRSHPPYMTIFAWLAGLTLVELLVPPVLGSRASALALTILVIIAIYKILLIIRYFMHLKFDARVLSLIAATPAVLASVLAIALLMDI